MYEIKQRDYDLLNEIGSELMVTLASFCNRWGIAVGSVNWYIEYLIQRG